MKLRLLACVLLFSLSGPAACGSDDDGPGGGTEGDGSLSDPEAIRIWANGASALGAYLHVYQPIAVADGEASFDDPSCPSVTDDGVSLELAGDCTDSTGVEWVGTASVERSANGDRNVTFDGFGTNTDGVEDTRSGEASVLVVDVMEHDFVLDLVHQGGVTTTVDYAGSVVGDYDTRTVWTGSGTVTREGVASAVGTIQASTTEEVVDDAVCSGQPASGSTVLESPSGDTVVITYDGSTDCDMEQAASYTLNGAPEGTISGIACSFSPAGRGQSRLAVGLVLLVGAVLGVRRQRARSPQRASC